MNSLMTIHPYRDNGFWVFDHGDLVKEPFVEGTPEIIDKVIESMGIKDKFSLVFSSQPFPNYQGSLTWKHKCYEGNYYQLDGTDMEGWLCPSLFKFFDKAPKNIFFKVHNQTETP